jgi:alpha-amylase
MVMTKQAGLSERLTYDHYERRSGLVRLLPRSTVAADLADGSAVDLVGAVDGAWTLESIARDRLSASFADGPVRIAKTVSIGGGRLDPTLSVEVDILNTSDSPFEALLGVEFALMLLGGGHNPAAFHDIGGRRIPHDERLEVADVTQFVAGNEQLGVAVETLVDAPATAWISPIESVSNSEAGFELVYQGSSVVLVRPITLGPGEAASMRLDLRVTIPTPLAAHAELEAPAIS